MAGGKALGFHLRLLPLALEELFRARERWVSLGELLAFLIALTNRHLAKRFLKGWDGVSPWWAAIPIGLLVVRALMRANYEQYRRVESEGAQVAGALRREIAALQATVRGHEERLDPKLRLSLDDPPWKERIINDSNQVVDQRLVQVRVTNESTGVVHGVEVRLIKAEPADDQPVAFAHLPVHLQESTDIPADGVSYQKTFSINAGDSKLFNVAFKDALGGETLDTIYVSLCFAGPRGQNRLPVTRAITDANHIVRDRVRIRYKFTISVTARDLAQPETGTFLLTTGAEGRVILARWPDAEA